MISGIALDRPDRLSRLRAFPRDLYSTANDPQPQMIPRPQMIPKMDRK